MLLAKGDRLRCARLDHLSGDLDNLALVRPPINEIAQKDHRARGVPIHPTRLPITE